ncbi:MAG: S1C family serine protease [Acidobacteriota bacterium]|nr:S1C family serine protease [Acidobacteriota bacterium]
MRYRRGARVEDLARRQAQRVIRLEVSIYPTSVGDAVADAQGNLLGLVAGGLSRVSVIAIPRGVIQHAGQSLETHGRVARGYLGIGLQAVAVPAALKLEQESGIMVVHVEEGCRPVIFHRKRPVDHTIRR